MYDLILSDEPYGTVAYAPYTLMSYNEVYGLYDDIREYVKEPYASMCEEFYRGDIELFDLNFRLIDTLIAREGAPITKFMLQDTVITSLESNPDHPLRVALRDNDTYDWAPQAPTRLFYCEGDDQVPFENSVIADSVMRANGAPSFNSANLSETATHTECITPAVTNTVFFFAAFAAPVTSTRAAYPQEVAFWPNPASQDIRIQGLPQGGHLRLVDLNGQVHGQWRTNTGTMNLRLPRLSSGIYVLSMESDRGYWTQKLVIRQ
jgi:hypothetical protein